MKRRWTLLVVVLFLGCPAATKPTLPEPVAVKVMLQHRKQPLRKAIVTLIPLDVRDDLRPQGFAEDGTLELRARPGEYKVTIRRVPGKAGSASDSDPVKPPTDPVLGLPAGNDPFAKYGDADTTALRVTIPAKDPASVTITAD
jgi:hypothetical protein